MQILQDLQDGDQWTLRFRNACWSIMGVGEKLFLVGR